VPVSAQPGAGVAKETTRPCKVKFSRGWNKAKARVQRLHARIANARRDYLHKASTTIRLAARANHAMVCIEGLQVRNMSRSAAGTIEVPGKNVRAKSGLDKAILDQGWREFRRQLDYKVAWHGGYLIAVPPQNTSRRCPCCGYVSAHNRPTQARFACEVSGAVTPPAAGTRQSDLAAGSIPAPGATGIAVL
jgi:putative transposase